MTSISENYLYDLELSEVTNDMKKNQESDALDKETQTCSHTSGTVDEHNETPCQEDFDDLSDDEKDVYPEKLLRIASAMSNQLVQHTVALKIIVKIVLLCVFVAYISWCIYCKRFQSEDDIRLVWISVAVVFIIVVKKCDKICSCKFLFDKLHRVNIKIRKHKRTLTIICVILIMMALILFLIISVATKRPYNLVSLSGILVFILICYTFSHNSKKVKWRPVVSGLMLQFVLALIILRTKPGYEIFDFFGKRVNEFLNHTNAGTSFVFGKEYEHHLIAFKILPNVIVFSSAISMLYYVGVIQMVIQKFAWVMHITMGTTAGESLNAAGNIFVGMAEAPLMIRPLIGKMTNSELHAVMSSGFATIAGNVLAIYIFFGLSPTHLLSASVMSAPAALSMAKLIYPETKKSMTTFRQVSKLSPSPYRSLIEAASGGATESIVLISNIVVNLISFIALFHFINETLMWFGDRACLSEPLTFEFVCSYMLWPIPLIMGVDLNDCKKVAYLLGIKVFLNEFIAYEKLSQMIRNRDILSNLTTNNFTMNYLSNGDLFVKTAFENMTLLGGVVTRRSEVIATYSLCGFSNIGSIGVTLSSLTALAPHRRSDLSGLVIRALIVGNIACFITACIAGLLLDV